MKTEEEQQRQLTMFKRADEYNFVNSMRVCVCVCLLGCNVRHFMVWFNIHTVYVSMRCISSCTQRSLCISFVSYYEMHSIRRNFLSIYSLIFFIQCSTCVFCLLFVLIVVHSLAHTHIISAHAPTFELLSTFKSLLLHQSNDVLSIYVV